MLFDFSRQSVIDDPIAIFVNRDRSFSFERQEDLLGKTAGLMLGDSVGDAFDQFLLEHLVIERVSEGYQNFGKLEREHIDFIPYGLHTGNLLVRRLGLEDVIVALPNVVITNHYYLAISRKSDLTQYTNLIDAELKRMRESGEIKRLTEHYIGMYSSRLHGDVPENMRTE